MSTDSSPVLSTGPTALQPDGVLVHVGMHKTGTTALQSMLAEMRGELAAEGVRYPGGQESHHREARALTQASMGWYWQPIQPPDRQVWTDFAADVRHDPSRVVISSEFFSCATEAQIHQLVADLGPARTQILIGVRNLGPVAVSTWQQTLKQGRVSTLDRWLQLNFQREDPADPPKWFWSRFDPAAAVARWAAAAGRDRVTVLVVREGDWTLLPATFERLLDLPAGSLTGRDVPRSNRGLTAIEAEVVRRVNHELRGHLQWRDYDRVVRNGAFRRMIEYRSPTPDEPRPELPAWVVGQVVREGRRVAEQVTASGVRVIGDLADLSTPPPPADPTGSAPDQTMVPIEAMVEAVVGAVAGATRGSWSLDAEPLNQKVSDHTAVQLAGIVATRLAHRVLRRHPEGTPLKRADAAASGGAEAD